MGKSRKGGYKLVSLQFMELTTMTALDGLYGAIFNSHEKPLLISDIIINGEKKNDIYCVAIKEDGKFTIKDIYGYDLEVNADDEVIVTEGDDGDVTIEVNDIKALTDAQCNQLKCGDKVLKVTNGQKHLYLVTYKKAGEGMCLTYMDASVLETQSYDFSGGHWVYNSEDKMPLIDVEGAQSGTIVDALGLNAQGKLVKGAIGGGTKLYKHRCVITGTGGGNIFVIVNNRINDLTISSLQDSLRGATTVSTVISRYIEKNTRLYDIVGESSTGTTYTFYGISYDGANISYQSGNFNITGGSSVTDTVTEL